MNENVRIYRRVKSRPSSDLRRKVLLKNFLREQMSSVPNQSRSLASNENLQPVEAEKSLENVDVENSESNGRENIEDSQESKSTLVFDFSKITELKLSQLAHVKKKSTPLSDADVKRISETYSNVAKEDTLPGTSKSNSVSITIDLGKVSDDKFNELAMLIKNNRVVKEKRKKGISKAKYVIKSLQRPFKRIQDKGKYLRDKITSSLKIFDESFKHDAPQVKKNSSEDDNKNLSKELIFESRGIKFSIQQNVKPDASKSTSTETSDLIHDKKTEVKTSDNSNNDTLCREMSKNILQSKTENNKLIVESKFANEKDQLKNDKVKGEKSFPKHFTKVLNAQDNVISPKKRSYESTQSQSIQTNISWSLQEIKKLERANKRLKEENKLLSESLSSIMADVAFSPYQKHVASDSYYNSSNHLKSFSNNEISHLNNEPMRARVLRSRSVQERAERRREVKMRLSSRSMCHRPYSRTSPKSMYRAKPCIVTNYESPKELPCYPASSRVLRSLPEYNYCSTLTRKSSMPERVPTRSVLQRRSSCVPDIQRPSIRCSLLSLPTEAFY